MILRYLFSIFLLLSSTSAFSETPKQMKENVFVLSETAAMINICLQSSMYDNLPTNKALKLHDLAFRLSNITEKISKHYSDDALLFTFEMMSYDISTKKEMKDYVKNKYNYCNDNLISEMDHMYRRMKN